MVGMNAILSEAELQRVQSVIIDQLHIKPEELTPEASLMNDLGADSLDMVEIGMKLEELFQCTIPDDLMEQIVTVDDVYDAVSRLLRRGSS